MYVVDIKMPLFRIIVPSVHNSVPVLEGSFRKAVVKDRTLTFTRGYHP